MLRDLALLRVQLLQEELHPVDCCTKHRGWLAKMLTLGFTSCICLQLLALVCAAGGARKQALQHKLVVEYWLDDAPPASTVLLACHMHTPFESLVDPTSPNELVVIARGNGIDRVKAYLEYV